MSLDSINTKVAIHRATDFAKEVSNHQKKAEMSHVVRQAQQDIELGRAPVEDIYKPDEAAIRREKEKRKRKDEQLAGTKSKTPGSKEPAHPEAGMAHTNIDIRI